MPKAHERDTREEILNLACEITQSRSFNWLSFQDLSNQLEIRKASVHYYFPTKQALGVALLKRYRARFAEWSTKVSARESTPAESLDAYFEMYKKMLGRSERVCPGGVFSLEWNTLPDEMKAELKGLLSDQKKWLEGVLRAGRKSGEFHDRGPVEEQAALIGSSVQGALQIARVQGSAASFNACIRQLRSLLLK